MGHSGISLKRRDHADPSSPPSISKRQRPDLAEVTPNLADSESEDEKGTPTDGMHAEVKDLYQRKDKDGDESWVEECPEDIQGPVETAETMRYALLVKNKKSPDTRKKLDIVAITVQSPVLKRVLGRVFDGYPEITTDLARLNFEAPFQPFVHRWDGFVRAVSREKHQQTKSHLDLLYKVMEPELRIVVAEYRDLVKHNIITYKHLWTIFEPGTTIIWIDHGHLRMSKLASAKYTTTLYGVPVFRLHGLYVDYDGDMFGGSREYLDINTFDGTKPITSLEVYPLQYHPAHTKLATRLASRGKLLEGLVGYQYSSYRGVGLKYDRRGNLVEEHVDGRIVVDTKAFNTFNPIHAISLQPLPEQAKQLPVTAADYTNIAFASLFTEQNKAHHHSPTSTHLQGASSGQKLSDFQRMTAVPYTRGYDLTKKEWMLFFLDQLSEIAWNDHAFDSLVLSIPKKDLLYAIVDNHLNAATSYDDIIAGKGRGTILLLSGPPGVGKTLTAESVAEHMRVPLFLASAGDLGTESSDIEQALQGMLTLAARWNAILLLDEADVFMEQRSSHELDRNRMVTIFLRMLEYYEGILFLTTNRLNSIDDAFHSRIHVSMVYDELDAPSRRQIWARLLRQVAHQINDADLDTLAGLEFNGRKIKNILKIAQLLATSDARKARTLGSSGRSAKEVAPCLMMRHLQTVLDSEGTCLPC
ncbi:hypothetical protein BDV09DRAFT_204344 [Aspergillus tetrazonus]